MDQENELSSPSSLSSPNEDTSDFVSGISENNGNQDESQKETGLNTIDQEMENCDKIIDHITENRNGKHPYNLILEEIWEKIFDWITDPEDLKSCLYTCSSFYNILQDRRVAFMFPQVFKIITENNNRKKKDHVDMLVCRSITKSWKDGVDNHYQALPYFFSLDYYAFDEEALKCITAFLCRVWNDPFSTDFVLSPRGLPELKRKLEQWKQASDKVTTNPFPSRHLAIYDSEDTLRDDVDGLIENMEMSEKVQEMMELFGHHVWYLTILLHMGVPSQRYLRLLDWLKCTPNLKVLSLYFRAGDEDFEEIVDECPFPEMSQLTVFQGDKVPNVVLKSVLKSNPQIERIQNQGAPSRSPFAQPKINQVFVESQELEEMNMNTATFSKLEKISIDFHVASEKPVQYSSYSIHSCELKNLLNGNGENCEIQLWKKTGQENNGIFCMLKRFEGTLVHFRLGLPDNPPRNRNGSFSLDAVCIDIILPLQSWSLKSVHVSAKCRDGYRWMDEKDVISQLHTYLQGRLHESTIWKLPEMKQVFVVDGCDGYLTLFL